MKADVLASSSSQSWAESGQYDFSPQRKISLPADTTQMKSRPLAVMLSGRFRSFWDGKEPPVPAEGEEPRDLLVESPETSILVVGTSHPARQEFLQLFPVDGVFLLNAVDWMTYGSDLIGIRSRTGGERVLPGLPQRAKTFLKVGNIVVFPALLALFGLSYLTIRRRRSRAR